MSMSIFLSARQLALFEMCPTRFITFDSASEADRSVVQVVEMVQNGRGEYVPEIQQEFVLCKNHAWRRTKSRKLVCKNCGVDKR